MTKEKGTVKPSDNWRSTSKRATWCCLLLTLLVAVVAILCARWYPRSTLEHGGPVENRASTLQVNKNTLSSLAFAGNLKAVQNLLQSKKQVVWEDYGHTTPIHYALQGRYNSLQKQSLQIIGQHEEVIAYLVNHAGADPSQGCPVYYAVNFRNLKALQILLTASHTNSSLLCLTSLDGSGLSALHTAAESKASGFARFFSKLRNDNNPSTDLQDLLGIQPLIKGTSDKLTLQELNSVLTSRDLQLIFDHLRAALDLSTVRDRHGNTVLHSAAYGGRLDVVELLLKEGMSPDVTNRFNVTPLHLAYAGHFCEVGSVLLRGGADPSWRDVAGRVPSDMSGWTTCAKPANKTVHHHHHHHHHPAPAPDPAITIAWDHYMNSGWYMGTLPHPRKCDLPVRNSSLGTEEFLVQYGSSFSPVLIQGLLSNWSAWDHWTHRKLDERQALEGWRGRYGSLSFTVSSMPYEQLYQGVDAKTRHTNLSEFVKQFDQKTEHPDYLFDGQVLDNHPSLAADAPVPALIANFSIHLKQLIIGPKGSGSPPHFHQHAINALVYGVKRWFLWPPRDSYFKFSHIGDWVKNDAMGYLECTQMPGEVLYIPNNWGHAVLNEAHSIGTAYEFIL